MSSMHEIIELCNICDIICLQERWLSKQNLDFLASIYTDFHGTGISFDDCKGMLIRSPLVVLPFLGTKSCKPHQFRVVINPLLEQIY